MACSRLVVQSLYLNMYDAPLLNAYFGRVGTRLTDKEITEEREVAAIQGAILRLSQEERYDTNN